MAAKNKKQVGVAEKSAAKVGSHVVTFWNGLNLFQRVATFAGLVGLALLLTSLIHLSHGVKRITGDHVILAWCVAIGIDLSIVSMKWTAIVCRYSPVWQDIKRVTNVTLAISLALSAGLNILSYIEGRIELGKPGDLPVIPEGLYVWSCVVLGLYIPYAIWAQSQVAAKLWSYKKGGPPRKRVAVDFHSEQPV